ALHHDLRVDLAGVAAGNHVFRGRGNENVAVQHQQLFGGHGLRAAESERGAVAVFVFDQLVNVDAGGIVQAAIDLRHADDLVAALVHEAGSVGADVAEALNHNPAVVEGQIQIAQALVASQHHAAAGGLDAASRTSDIERLAGDHAGHGVAHVHGVG